MIIFGIDQGLAHMGYSVIEVVSKKTKRKGFIKIDDKFYVKIIEKGCIITTSKEEFTKRLFRLITKIENKILEYEPDLVCCETLFFSMPAKGSRNKSASIMTTNMVTGNIAYICGKNRVKFATYSPTRVKKNLCGNGKAPKEEIIAKIKELFEIDVPNGQLDHICDSIAIAIAHLYADDTNIDDLEESSIVPEDDT